MQHKVEFKLKTNELSIRIECEYGSIYATWDPSEGLDLVAWRYMVEEIMRDKVFGPGAEVVVIEDEDA